MIRKIEFNHLNSDDRGANFNSKCLEGNEPQRKTWKGKFAERKVSSLLIFLGFVIE